MLLDGEYYELDNKSTCSVSNSEFTEYSNFTKETQEDVSLLSKTYPIIALLITLVMRQAGMSLFTYIYKKLRKTAL